MKIYNIIDGNGEPLAIYTDPMEARFCDEIKEFHTGYKCIRETYSDAGNYTRIKYEQKEMTEFGEVTNHKTVTIYTMELQGIPRCTCCGETENLVSGASASGDTIYLCQAAAREALAEKE